MRYSRVRIDTIAYELPPNVVTSAALEDRLAPVLKKLGIPLGQFEAMTGIRERRFWNPGQTMADGATKAGRKALETSGVTPDDVGLLIFAGVCRDHIEPATACAVADALGVTNRAEVYDVSNACLGVLNGMVQVANAIELGHIRAGLVVSCESSREIVEQTIDELRANPDMELLKTSLATLTGGSGAVAVLLADETFSNDGHGLLGGVALAACEHHRLCSWGPQRVFGAEARQVAETHAIEVLENGVALGVRTYRDFVGELGWEAVGPDKIICHQVGATNQAAILKALEIPPERDFATFEYLGNIGTVSLPITAAIADERGFLEPGDRVGLLGISSGLNCLMLGVDW
ncbi:MAG: 3-oxoacyl-ACP synthase III [Planctomycetes bacterium]|nr:3-oxoacyl-ACP synthase III [Planctomycetota bacterium]